MTTTPHVTPHFLNNVHVKIMCPHCGEEHTHGSCGGKNYAGHRAAHCKNMPDNAGYYIEEMVNQE